MPTALHSRTALMLLSLSTGTHGFATSMLKLTNDEANGSLHDVDNFLGGSADLPDCLRMVRIRTGATSPDGYNYLKADTDHPDWCEIRGITPSDDLDLYLWHWCTWTTPSGRELVALRNHKTGKYMTTSHNGGDGGPRAVHCGHSSVGDKETWVVGAHWGGPKDYNLQSYDNQKWLGTRTDPTAWPYRQIDGQTDVQARASTPSQWEWWVVEDAISTPVGEWVSAGMASTPRDQKMTYTKYTDGLKTDQTNSFSESFTVSVEAGFEFEGGESKTSFSSTTAFSVSESISRDLTMQSGSEFVHFCPKEVCTGAHPILVWQWKVSASTVSEAGTQWVLSGDTVIFAATIPKCPPTLCTCDQQCQECCSSP